MIRLLIVDDQRLMRDGLQTLLSMEHDMEVAGTASDGQEAVRFISHTLVDAVLMDIRMPAMNGIEATRRVLSMSPQTKILMLTTFEEKEDVVAALSAGAVGYLLKDMPAEEIADAIRTAVGGGAVLPPKIARTFLSAMQEKHLAGPADPGQDAVQDTSISGSSVQPPGSLPNESLTEREVDVLRCLAKGLSNREMAETLFITEGTVKNHVSNLIAKLDLRDRTQVALWASRRGYGAP